MWKEGTIAVPTPNGGTVTFKWQIKQYKTGSQYGINEGRISKLWIKNTITGEVVANYDRGWDIKPDENNQQVMIAYYIILKDYN